MKLKINQNYSLNKNIFKCLICWIIFCFFLFQSNIVMGIKKCHSSNNQKKKILLCRILFLQYDDLIVPGKRKDLILERIKQSYDKTTTSQRLNICSSYYDKKTSLNQIINKKEDIDKEFICKKFQEELNKVIKLKEIMIKLQQDSMTPTYDHDYYQDLIIQTKDLESNLNNIITLLKSESDENLDLKQKISLMEEKLDNYKNNILFFNF
ncbi:hypothetical protein [Candidatus Phytoplasma sacchari]|uniref:Sequence-variable mosaic (SVM) signal sequence domain-containing protein n=1 Tax=Candidatus Phytoplasma sacchari TaxID=2609813 RepID=A0ABY7M2N9_9MOLU|nr:hypothetical protein O7R10_01270 [Candidatus Phytoplasma sacchari]